MHDVEERLLAWLKARAPEMASQVTLDTELFERGILDSFSLIELVDYVEALRGAQIDVELLVARNFSTVRGIHERFLVRSDSAAGQS